jgi:hypothetical protein
MHIYTIYRATNTINGKVYIGFDSAWPSRIKSHQQNSVNLTFPFYRAAKKYGWDSFVWEAIYQSKDLDHCLNTMEPFFIVDHDSYRNGYNGTRGGDFGSLGSHWWNNGQEELFTEFAPDGFVKGRLPGAFGGAERPWTLGSHWWNNGSEQKMSRESPGNNWVKGRISNNKVWWNNGTNEQKSVSCPGVDYTRGRRKGFRRLSNLQVL